MERNIIYFMFKYFYNLKCPLNIIMFLVNHYLFCEHYLMIIIIFNTLKNKQILLLIFRDNRYYTILYL